MKKLQQIIRLLGAAVLCLVLAAAAAQGAPATDPVPGFTVRAVLPENQLDSQSYFQLLTPPGHSQTLELEVQNQLSEPMTLRIQVTGASSGAYGVIVYEDREKGASISDGLPQWLRLAREEIAVDEDQGILALEEDCLTLAPFAIVTLPFALVLPEQPVEGHALGGIVVTKLDETEQVETTSFAVGSVYSYAIAVQIQSERQPAATPAFSLGQVSLEKQAGFPALTAALHNEAPLVVARATLRLQLFAAQEESPLLDTGTQRFAMAPLTTMPYTVPLPTELYLVPGDYRVLMVITLRGGQYTFEATLRVPEVTEA